MPSLRLFSRVRHSLLLKLGRTQETSYPPELTAQMNLLPIMRDLADDVQRCVDAIATKFHLEEGSASNVSENFAMPLKVLIEQITDHKEYVEFLKTQCELYDDIGQIQRNLHTGLQDMVLNPLRTFIITDFDRIMREITTLNERRRDMDIAAEEAKRGAAETKMQRAFRAEQTKRDYEMQLALVKAELRKLPTIQIEQAKCLKCFNELMFNYHSQIEALLVKHRADKV